MQKIVNFSPNVRIFSHASAVGREESEGPYGKLFDFHDLSDRFDAKTWELAEGNISATVLSLALNKAKLSHEEIDLLFAGDLQNQCVASSLGLTPFALPYIGIYGACSTSAEGLYLAASVLSVTNTPIETAAVVTTSHNSAAERQFRLPLEYGGQRPPTAQWTVTGGGAFLLCRRKSGVFISQGMAGIPKNAGVSDANNMGAAMAPAAADSLERFFQARGESPLDYDAVITGDLGREGSAILVDLLAEKGIDILQKHYDCGAMIYDGHRQDCHSGGSGCGCSASILSAYFLPKLEKNEIHRVLFSATGALMSPSSVMQGESIIGISPVLRLLSPKEGEKSLS